MKTHFFTISITFKLFQILHLEFKTERWSNELERSFAILFWENLFVSMIKENHIPCQSDHFSSKDLKLLWYKTDVEKLKRNQQLPIHNNSREPLLLQLWHHV